MDKNYKPITSMKEVPEQLRKLRRQYLRYQQAEIIYSISHKKLNLDESNGKRLVSEKLDAGYSEYVMGRRHQQTSRFSNQAVTFKRNGKNT